MLIYSRIHYTITAKITLSSATDKTLSPQFQIPTPKFEYNQQVQTSNLQPLISNLQHPCTTKAHSYSK